MDLSIIQYIRINILTSMMIWHELTSLFYVYFGKKKSFNRNIGVFCVLYLNSLLTPEYA